ncbi:unnamed protein product [Lampetra fluviatilis]
MPALMSRVLRSEGPTMFRGGRTSACDVIARTHVSSDTDTTRARASCCCCCCRRSSRLAVAAAAALLVLVFGGGGGDDGGGGWAVAALLSIIMAPGQRAAAPGPAGRWES